MSELLPESSAVAPSSEGGDGLKSIHLVVMGLTGAGKSTFVSTATGDPSVVVDAGISGGKHRLFKTRY
jgi:signal recognition particle receptor subunit beta